jgi:hypothetical protein
LGCAIRMVLKARCQLEWPGDLDLCPDALYLTLAE